MRHDQHLDSLRVSRHQAKLLRVIGNVSGRLLVGHRIKQILVLALKYSLLGVYLLELLVSSECLPLLTEVEHCHQSDENDTGDAQRNRSHVE